MEHKGGIAVLGIRTLAVALILINLLGASGQHQLKKLSVSPCSAYPVGATHSCQSFLELLDRHDRQLLPLLNSGSLGTTYVCFDETQDRFLVVAAFLPQGKMGFVSHDEYRNGMRESNYRHNSLQWYPPLGKEDHTYPEDGGCHRNLA
jgi:hypothetical protein